MYAGFLCFRFVTIVFIIRDILLNVKTVRSRKVAFRSEGMDKGRAFCYGVSDVRPEAGKTKRRKKE